MTVEAAQEMLAAAHALLVRSMDRDRRPEAYDDLLDRADAAASDGSELLATQVRVVGRECHLLVGHLVVSDDAHFAGARARLRVEARLLSELLADHR